MAWSAVPIANQLLLASFRDGTVKLYGAIQSCAFTWLIKTMP